MLLAISSDIRPGLLPSRLVSWKHPPELGHWFMHLIYKTTMYLREVCIFLMKLRDFHGLLRVFCLIRWGWLFASSSLTDQH
jgi:hypothetical protein